MAIDPFRLNLRHIRAVSSISATKRIVTAAREVGLSQPALTQGLARLERRIGVRLFQRCTEGMIATSMGTLMSIRSVDLFDHLAQALRQRTSSGRGFSEPEKLVTMTQLRAMLALADSGSFVAASKRSGLSPSAICRAVRDMEHIVGVQLAERSGRKVVITDPGLEATSGFRRALSCLQSALDRIADFGSETEAVQSNCCYRTRQMLLSARAPAGLHVNAHASREPRWRQAFPPRIQLSA